jgi:hypothetical protein
MVIGDQQPAARSIEFFASIDFELAICEGQHERLENSQDALDAMETRSAEGFSMFERIEKALLA